MTLLLVILMLAVLGLIVAVVAAVVNGRLDGGLEDPVSSVPPRLLPAGEVSASDVAGLRFVAAFRGYRMDQVDAALARVEEELARRDEELVRLRRLVPASDVVPPEPLGEVDAVGEEADAVEADGGHAIAAGALDADGTDAVDAGGADAVDADVEADRAAVAAERPHGDALEAVGPVTDPVAEPVAEPDVAPGTDPVDRPPAEPAGSAATGEPR